METLVYAVEDDERDLWHIVTEFGEGFTNPTFAQLENALSIYERSGVKDKNLIGVYENCGGAVCMVAFAGNKPPFFNKKVNGVWEIGE